MFLPQFHKKYKRWGEERVSQKVTFSARMSRCSFVSSSCRMMGRKWHLANSKQGAHQWRLKRHLASITVKLVFGSTTAEQVDAGQLSPQHLFMFKMECWWGHREQLWLQFHFHLCVCSQVCVFILCTWYQSACMWAGMNHTQSVEQHELKKFFF